MAVRCLLVILWLTLCTALACNSSTGANAEDFASSMAATDDGSTSTQTSTTGTADASASGGTVDSGTGASEDGAKFDIPIGDVADSGGDCQCGSELEFSYIWVANSNAGMVSKINTETVVEEARYRTHPDPTSFPSRTAVSLSGRAVAVANREGGGLVKVLADADDCDPGTNGQPGLQTSSGPADVYAWGEDDCVAWFVDSGFTVQRPVAWIAGSVDPVTCAHTDEKVWTGGCAYPADTWSWAHLVDGTTGAIEAMVELDGLDCGGMGPYGGAVDVDGNVWMHQRDAQKIARIDAVTHDVQVWPTPTSGYGITVDDAARPWITAYNMTNGIGAARFDPDTQIWDVVDDHWVAGTSGIQQDASGKLWLAYQQYDQQMSLDGGMTWIDPVTLTFGPEVDLPGTWPKGVSIDLAGRIWAVDVDTNSVYRYDPQDGDIVTLGGFMLPYTYSDMTGWAVQNAYCMPAG